jgi:hypothetical protein
MECNSMLIKMLSIMMILNVPKINIMEIILISGLFDVINKIPLSYHITKSNENDFNKKKKLMKL